MSIFRKVTLKTLLVNKTRTLVTIIGIILSLAMFTAVTVSVSSFQDYLLNVTMHREGNWHASVSVTEADCKNIRADKSVDCLSFLRTIGYAKLTDCSNPDKPYLYIGGMDEKGTDMLPVNITSGRLPENDTELLIPAHLAYNGNIQYQLGDILTLEIGDRISVDEKGKPYLLDQNTAYLYTQEELEEKLEKQELSEEDADSYDTESFSPRFTRTYTVVGFYDRPNTEPYTAPGYTALTLNSTAADNSKNTADNSAANTANDTTGNTADNSVYNTTDSSACRGTAYIRFHDPKDAVSWLETHYTNSESQSNYSLLRMYGASYENTYNRVLYGMAAILICIILFGSISLIYNAFSISVTERTKQFGLLSSLGATRRQLTHGVLFEAFSLCIIGIPLGILAGIIGIGITFALLGPSVSNVLMGDENVIFSLHVSPAAVICAAFIGLLTVLVSAWLPARRATKLSPIDAIRQTADIAIRPGRVKTSRLTYRLFGLSGMLASKNFKRNRKKYRATVISLFVSVVLFISASSFCSYLMAGAESVMSDSGYDISYRRYPEDAAETTTENGTSGSGTTTEGATENDATNLSNDELLQILSSLDGITDAAWVQYESTTLYFDKNALSREYLDYIADTPTVQESQEAAVQGKIGIFNTTLYFISDDVYEAYLEKSGLPVGQFTDSDHPVAVVSDFVRVYDPDTGKYTTLHLMSSDSSAATLLQLNIPEDYYNSGYSMDEYGNICYYFNKEESKESLEVPASECTVPTQLAIGAIADEVPFFTGDDYGYSMILMYPASAMDTVLGASQAAATRMDASVFYFTANDHKRVAEDISETLQGLGLNSSSVYDMAETAAQDRTLLLIITVFSYGFIILISLIAMANVFNTISTNVQLRRREFAMLRSTGMTPEGFRIMMCYECLLYGVKGLLYGLPVAIAVTYWIYRSISGGWVVRFYIPWYSLIIAVGSVFLVVGSTMIYSMKKIGKENIMDNLKTETT